MALEISENETSYVASDKMRHLIKNDSQLLFVMTRFGIALGFGEKTVRETCQEHGVDVETFLAVSNYISGNPFNTESISISPLVSYLKQAHAYFLDFKLPAIRQNILEAIDCSGKDEIAFLILNFYDKYVTEVRRHMEYENEVVFSYVDGLLEGILSKDYEISDFVKKHNHIDAKLKELKNVIIRYYPQKNNDQLCSVLFDIINCESDLSSHCLVEDNLFVPAVQALEEILREKGESPAESVEEEDIEEGKSDILSQREKEIIICVTKGMSNKMIANALNISVHTVTTHRRNISSKLQIHTQAGLTIYAIVNGLITTDEIKAI